MELDPEIIRSIQEVINQGDLQFGGKIGEGGFGVVYKGVYKYQDVAIKKMIIKNHGKNSFEKAVRAFVKEMQIHSKIRGERLLTLTGVSFDTESLCVITPYQEGGSLEHAIYHNKIFSQGTKEEIFKKKLQCMIEIAEGIVILHTYDPPIVHRDLKPLNILIDSRGGIKIADLGLATQARNDKSQEASVTQAAIGSIHYMAPDCFQEKQKIHLKADI